MNTLVIVTPPTKEPISLQLARYHCRIDGTHEDELLTMYIAAARLAAEEYLRRRLITQTWDYYLDRFPREHRWIVPPTGPVQGVVSISYLDYTGETRMLPSDQYIVDTRSKVGRIEPKYNEHWPITRHQVNAVNVRLLLGYGDEPETVPENIRLAILHMVGHWYEHREPIVVGGGVSEIPMTSMHLLRPLRVVS